MQSNPHSTQAETKSKDKHSLLSRFHFFAVLTAVLLALTLISVSLLAPRSASAAPGDQPSIGPGLPQVGSNAPKSALSSTKAGSILFFHKYTSDAANAGNVNTLVTVTNTNPRDAVAVRLFYVRDCTTVNVQLNFAANQTRTLLMSSEDPGKTGYIVAVAVNAQGLPTQFNWLIGTASLHDAQGHEASYNAVSVAKRTAGSVAGDNAGLADIKFDDTDYDRLPQLVAVDSLQNQDASAGDAVQTDIALYSPLADLRGTQQSLRVVAIAYDQSGRPYPQLVDTGCALNRSVSDIWTAPALSSYLTPTRPGWGSFAAAGLDGAPLPLLGASFTDGANASHDARSLHVLGRLDSFTMKFPIVAPQSPSADVLTTNLPDAVGGSLGASEIKAGSVLIFPRFTSGTYGSSHISITNTHPTRPARVRVVFSGLADATGVTEAIITINPNQAKTVDANEFAPNQKGWLLATTIDNIALPVNFNFLIGSAQVREQSGLVNSYNALSVAKNSVGSAPRNTDQQTADLKFNDLDYDRLSATLAAATVWSQFDNTTTLGYIRPPASLLDPINTRGSVAATIHDDLLNQAGATIGGIEVKLGTVKPTLTSPPITNSIVKGHRGWLKLTPSTPIFAWLSNVPSAPLTINNTLWTGGLAGVFTPHILATAESFTLRLKAVNANASAPVADFEPIPVYLEARRSIGTIVRLDGRLSADPDLNDKLTYQWFDNDAPISTAPVSDYKLSIGQHLLKLIVTDSTGLTSEPRSTLSEVRDTTPPILSGVPTDIIKGTSNAGGALVNFTLPVAWDTVDGPVEVLSSRQPGKVFPSGRTQVTFTARDSAGNESKASFYVTVRSGSGTQGGTPRNQTPYLNNLHDQYVLAGKPRSIVLVAEDGDNDPVSFTLLNAPAYATLDSIDPVARKATLLINAGPADPVATMVRVMVSDGRGGTFTTLPFRIQVSDVENDDTGSGNGPGGTGGGGGGTGGDGGGGGGGGTPVNNPPVARAAAIAPTQQATIKQGAIVHLDGSASSDADLDPLSYKWTDNGVPVAEGAIADVVFPVGPHAVVLTVTDGKGGSNATAPQAFTVLPRPLTVASVTPPKLTSGYPVNLTITGTGFNQDTKIRFDCTATCIGGSQVTVTITSIDEDQITVTAKTTRDTPRGNRDLVVTNPDGASVKLARSNYVSP